MENKFYVLPSLPFDYNALEPYMSAQTITIHHDALHQKYVNNANHDLEKLDAARKSDAEVDMKALLKDLSFNVGGHVLHSIFWESLCHAGDSPDNPQGELGEAVEREYGNFDRFRQEFSKAAFSGEGSAWAALAICRQTGRPMVMQIEILTAGQ
jgi:Fe-Mn family superoxide dismutase